MRYIFVIVGTYNAILLIMQSTKLLCDYCGLLYRESNRFVSYLFHHLLIDPWALVNIIVTFRHRACLLVRNSIWKSIHRNSIYGLLQLWINKMNFRIVILLHETLIFEYVKK